MASFVDSLIPPGTPKNTPPGPSLVESLKLNLEFTQDQVGHFRKMHGEYGDVSKYRLGPYPTYQFDHPDAINEILVKKADVMIKDLVTHDLEDIVGQGLLVSEGDFWRRQRKLAAPALTRKQISSYADAFVGLTNATCDKWEGQLTRREFHNDMMDLTLRIAVKTLFNLELDDDVHEVSEAIDTAMEFFHLMTHTLWRFVPKQIPTPAMLKYRRAVKRLDDMIYDLIRRRRADGTEGDDLLWRLIIANDDEGNQMTDKQLRDEVLTMFLAGHETTALALTYTWWLLTKNPATAAKLNAEVDEVLGKTPATVEDYGRLPYTKAVVQESMRLYSPAWIIGREPTEDVEIAGYHVPKGAQIIMCQSVVHRDPRWFEQPSAFKPERWLDGLEKQLPRFAYFPFGGGPRVCIGNHFAMMEAILCVATLAQRYDFTNESTESLRTQPAVTLRPISEIIMRVEPR